MKNTTAILASALGLSLASLNAQNVPLFINYQGRVTDSAGVGLGTGTPINRRVIFRIFDAPNAGNRLWSEEHTVTISNGEFSVLLGNGIDAVYNGSTETPSRSTTPLDTVFTSSGSQRFVEIVVDNGDNTLNNTDTAIAPRQQITSTAYSFRAASADRVSNGAISSAMLAPGAALSNIAANTIDNTKLATGAVTTAAIAANAIDSSKLAAGAVTNAAIANDAINSSKIADGTVATADLANGSVSSAKLDGSIALWGASGGNFFRTTGNVGIGTNTPQAKLDVVGGSQITMNHSLADWSAIHTDTNVQINWTTGVFLPPGTGSMPNRTFRGSDSIGFINAFSSTFFNPVTYTPKSLTTTLGIRSELLVGSGQGFVTYSDRRIKRDIRASETAGDLAAIKKLKVSDYRMVDPADGGMAWRKGFIAQEVEKVIPGAIARSREFIPDIFSLATATAYDPATKSLSLTLEKDHDLKVGEHVRLHVDGKRLDLRVTTVPSVREFRVGDCESAPEKVLVYGRQVDDFRTVDYDRIFTTSVGALQELKKEKDAEVKSLRDENSAMRDRLAALEADRKTHDAKLEALEKLVISIKPPGTRTVSLKAGE